MEASVETRLMSSSQVLIRLPNWVGDIMMALPAIQAIRDHFSDVSLIGMARPEHVELVRRISALDNIIPAPVSYTHLRAHETEAEIV